MYPSFLPHGRHFLYLVESAQREHTGIYVGALDSKETKRVLGIRGRAVYAPPGYLLFARQRTLMAQPFDTNSLHVTGEPLPIADGQRFLVNTLVEEPPAPPITIVLNWTAGLKR